MVSKSFCAASEAVCVCMLNFSTFVSYGGDLVARQQLVSTQLWALPGEEEDNDSAGLTEPIG